MTVRINFLPRTYQPQKRMGPMEWGTIGAAVLVLTVGAAYYGSTYAAVAGLERNAADAQAKLQVVKSGLTQAAEIKIREDKVTKEEADLKSLSGHKWSSVLSALSDSTPKHVTWTSLKVDGDSIVLKGTNRGLIDVAQLFGSLVNDPNVALATLKYVNENGVPITMSMKGSSNATGIGAAAVSSDSGGAGGKSAPGEAVLGTFRQMEFEMHITLVKAEGRQIPHDS